MAIIRRQRKAYDCGSACVANFLNTLYYDIPISKADVLCNLTVDGTDGNDLIRAIGVYGFEGHEYNYYRLKLAWDWLMKHTNRGTPVILSVDNDTHWLLVLRAGEETAQIFDPDHPEPELVNKQDLVSRWGVLSSTRQHARYNGLSFKPTRDKAIEAVRMRKVILDTIDVK